MTANQQGESIARSEDLSNLLNHIAWTDTIYPALEAEKRRLQDLVTASVLGTPIVASNGQTVTAEKLAGMCYGIDFIIRLFRDVLRKGEKAIRDLEKTGLHITSE